MKLMQKVLLASLVAAPLYAVAENGHFRNGQSLNGQAADAAKAGSARVIDLSTMKGSQIAYGETIVFKGADGRQFAWTFNGLDRRAVRLARIAPAEIEVGDAQVYVGPNPLTRN